jgi:acetyl esterase/lipase
MTLKFDDADLAEAMGVNRRLARAPRFRVRNRLEPLLMQALLRASQVGANRRLRRQGLSVGASWAPAPGRRVPLRVIRPEGPVRGVVLDIHGGGWAIGNARMDDPFNAALARACDVAVVSVDYRLAGATPIEGLLEDCLAAAVWLLESGPADLKDKPVIIVGESAGAHLAAATLLQLKGRKDGLRRIAGAILYYGVYDLAGTESVRRAGPDTLVLHGPAMLSSLRLLTPGLEDKERRRPPLSPLYGDLEGLPPALMFVGDLDPLHDDTVRMAAKWSEVAPVEAHRVPASPHGFIRFRTRLACKVLARSEAWIRERIADSA